MNNDILLKKAHDLLSDARPLIEDGKIEDVEAGVTSLEREIRNLPASSQPTHTIPTRICAAHCADNFSLYTGAFFIEDNGIRSFFCGQQAFHDAVAAYIGNGSGISDTFELEYGGRSHACHVADYPSKKGVVRVVAYSPSVFFSRDLFYDHAERIAHIVFSLNVECYDFYDNLKRLEKWLADRSDDLFCLCYTFRNFYTIFKHLGIDQVEQINEYIHNRIGRKYDTSLLIYQYSFEIFLVFFEMETADKKVVFSYNGIPIPYTVKKLLLKGQNKYRNINEFIATV